MSDKSVSLRKLYWILSVQFGMDPLRAARSLRGLLRYRRDLRQFRSGYVGELQLVPCLSDWSEEGGATHNEYFWQDLLVAQRVRAAEPLRHVDVGSRVDGFVAHVASFRSIEVFDIRPITSRIPGVQFKQWDAMSVGEGLTDYCDSLSCLHALEHFGLGRYGDPINPQGYEVGFGNMARLVKVGGRFYLSVPIGVNRVEFNANRVFDPRIIVELAQRHSFDLEALTVVQSTGAVQEHAAVDAPLADLAAQRYNLGIFTFVRRA